MGPGVARRGKNKDGEKGDKREQIGVGEIGEWGGGPGGHSGKKEKGPHRAYVCNDNTFSNFLKT